jgi:hypothetical protein
MSFLLDSILLEYLIFLSYHRLRDSVASNGVIVLERLTERMKKVAVDIKDCAHVCEEYRKQQRLSEWLPLSYHRHNHEIRFTH